MKFKEGRERGKGIGEGGKMDSDAAENESLC